MKPKPLRHRSLLFPVFQAALRHPQHLGGVALAVLVSLPPLAEEVGEGGMVHDKCPQTTDDRVSRVKVGARLVDDWVWE